MWNKISSCHSSNNLIFSKTKHYIKNASYESSLCQLYHDRCDTLYRYTHIIAYKYYIWILSHYRKHTKCPCLTAKFCRCCSRFRCLHVAMSVSTRASCFLLSRSFHTCRVTYRIVRFREGPILINVHRMTAIDQSLG